LLISNSLKAVQLQKLSNYKSCQNCCFYRERFRS
jgi:hypothetical protein